MFAGFAAFAGPAVAAAFFFAAYLAFAALFASYFSSAVLAIMI